jgi:hypothetical protein
VRFMSRRFANSTQPRLILLNNFLQHTRHENAAIWRRAVLQLIDIVYVKLGSGGRI